MKITLNIIAGHWDTPFECIWYAKDVKCCPVLSCSVMADSLPPHGLWPARLLCPWGFSRQEYWSGLPCPPPGALPNPGIEPRSPTLQVDSLSSELPGKPKNTWLGSLSLLQGIFSTQESNWGLLNCRQKFYQLSYQGGPHILEYLTVKKYSQLSL